jgi:cyclohexyl-isocyanide hydratase
MKRREFLVGAAALSSGVFDGLMVLGSQQETEPNSATKVQTGRQIIAMLVYPGFTALDLIGPYQFFCALPDHQVLLVSKVKGKVVSDTGLEIVTDCSFQDCPKDLSVIFVPGGTEGTLASIKDRETMNFVRDRGARAKYVTSVCTGSLILAAAGFLKGKKAASHWAVRDLLKDFDAVPTNQRVVTDGRIVTGAGVSAGLDMGLLLVKLLSSEEYAKQCQLWFEYDPEPIFDSGTPEKSKPEDVSMLLEMAAPFRLGVRRAAKSLRSKQEG